MIDEPADGAQGALVSVAQGLLRGGLRRAAQPQTAFTTSGHILVHSDREMRWGALAEPEALHALQFEVDRTALPRFLVHLDGERILVKDGKCLRGDGTLAGSTLDMAAAVRNCVRLLNVPLEDALRFATVHPASFLGLEHRLGRLAAGCRADMVALDPHNITVLRTWIAGREFETTDTRDAARVVILNQAAAERLFPGRDPIGQRVAWTGEVLQFIPVSGDWRTVVGVVGDTRSATLEAEPRPAMYQPFEQEEVFAGSLVVRASSDPEALLVPATQIVRSVDPTVPIGKVGTLAELRDESVASQRINAVLVSGFGAVALLIAAVGLAGVLGFSVSQRINEIGVRMSLGAHPRQVRRMIVTEGATLLVIGLAIGAVASLFASRVVEGMLYGVSPTDPLTFAVITVMLVLTAVLAAVTPARRAALVDPLVALRAE